MATKFNPFHKWLGLNEKLTNPHHFQLLGISPKISDPSKFKKAAHAAAQAQLAKLKAIDVKPQYEPLRKKLKGRIVLAHDILVDDEKRNAYIKQLKAKAGASKSTKMSGLKLAESNPAAIDPTVSEAPTVAPATPRTANQNANAAIPMAVPISQSPSQDDEPIFAVPDAPGAGNSDGPSFENLDGEAVKVFTGRRKRKGTWLVPLLSLLFMAAGVIGITSLVLNYDNLFSSLRDPVPTPTVGTVVEPLTDPNAASGDAVSGEKIGQPAQPLTEEELAAVKNRAEQMELPEAEKLDPDSEENNNAAMASNVPADDPFGTVTLGDNQVATLKFVFSRARKMFARGDVDQARELLEFAKDSFSDVNVVEEQFALKKEALASLEIADQLDGYWNQVKTSSMAMPGGQEMEVKDQIIGFVEGRDEDVVLAIGGDRNVIIPYRSLRPGLSQAIANQGAIASVPRWRLQEAAHYAVHAGGSSDLKKKAVNLIAQSEADGFDGAKLRDFIVSKFGQVGAPASKQAAFDKAKLESLMKQVRGGDYSDPLKVSAEQALAQSKELLKSITEDPEVRIAELHEAYLLSITARRPLQMLDVMAELKQWSEVDSPRLLKEGLIELSQLEMDKDQLREFGEAFLEYLELPESLKIREQVRAQMKSGAFKLMFDANILDVARRIEQTIAK